MKAFVVVLALATNLALNSFVFATGSYDIQITRVNGITYSVKLVNSYSDYYNKTLPGIFVSRKTAEQAGQTALKNLHQSDANDEPDPCSHDIRWL